jgi:hypothetical protein
MPLTASPSSFDIRAFHTPGLTHDSIVQPDAARDPRLARRFSASCLAGLETAAIGHCSSLMFNRVLATLQHGCHGIPLDRQMSPTLVDGRLPGTRGGPGSAI